MSDEKEIHLMFQTTPLSYCSKRLRDNSGMKQTFKHEEVTCHACLEVANHELEIYLDQIQQLKQQLEEQEIELEEYRVNAIGKMNLEIAHENSELRDQLKNAVEVIEMLPISSDLHTEKLRGQFLAKYRGEND